MPSPSPRDRWTDLDRPPLDADALRAALDAPWTDVVVTASTGSTNTDAAQAARAGAPHGTVHTTDLQTAGRGRLDRAWTMPPRSGVSVSVVLRPDVEPSRWVWLPLLVGLAVDAAAHDLGVESALKWPNDVLVDDRKLGGILLERVETPQGPAAVVGIGVNVSLRADELPVDTATSLLLEGATTTDRTVVVRSLLRTLGTLYDGWVASGGVGPRDAYAARCATIGRRVDVHLPDGSTHTGVAETVDEHGRLVVDGLAVSAGDVVHVRPAAERF